ncbi:uncharacterized protein PAC_11040 [Phialocephala subalpina]|uniref:C2H2-type domain-containing protein n=1 Tax=Phialocephala subalpina TaxID=576137 RepID=A0A1L7X7Z8_9HELO|nr:uncharacterized protein PAC_11040 [Phialocephala subalpina]
MSSGNLCSDILIRELSGLPNHLFFENPPFARSRDSSQDHHEVATSFSTTLSEPPNIDWYSINAWNYDNTAHVGQPTGGDTTPTTDISETWSANASSYSNQGCCSPMSSGTPMSWGFNHNCTMRHPQVSSPPFIPRSFTSLDTNVTSAQIQYPSYLPPHHLYAGYIHAASHDSVDNASPTRPRRVSDSTPLPLPPPKPKIHRCPRCERIFARPPDLQRHIDGVHLRRVPFMIRWPGHVPSNVTSNEIVHVTDIFSTILSVTGTALPTDRPIDGIDQTAFFRDPSNRKPKREGFLFYIKNDLRAIKWRDWKLHLFWEPQVNEGKGKLESPYLFNVVRDPKEESDVLAYNTWTLQPILKMQAEFFRSLKKDPAPKDELKEAFWG